MVLPLGGLRFGANPNPTDTYLWFRLRPRRYEWP
jgi:hypothetical protein